MSLRKMIIFSLFKNGLHLAHAFSAVANRKVQNLIDHFIQPANQYPDHWDYGKAPNIVTAAQTLGINPIVLGELLGPILAKEGKNIFGIEANTLVMSYQGHAANIDNSPTEPRARREALKRLLEDGKSIHEIAPILDELMGPNITCLEGASFDVGDLLVEAFLSSHGIRRKDLHLSDKALAALISRIDAALQQANFEMPPMAREMPELTIVHSR